MDTLRTKRFRAEVFVLYSKHTTQDGIQSSLSAPGSRVWIVLR